MSENRKQYHDTTIPTTSIHHSNYSEDIGKFYRNVAFHRSVLKKPVLLRARKRSYRGRDVKLISLKYRGREGFAVIAGCSVNTRIKCAQCNADRQVGKRSKRDCPILVSRNSRCYLSSFPPSLVLVSFLFFSDPFRGLATEEKVIFERRNFYEPTAGSGSRCVFKSAVHK